METAPAKYAPAAREPAGSPREAAPAADSLGTADADADADAHADAHADAARPRSGIDPGDGLTGLAWFCAAWLVIVLARPHPLLGTWLVLLATALPMLAREWRRAEPAEPAAKDRFALLPWLLGFALAAAPFLLLHAQGMGLGRWGLAWTVAAPVVGLRLVLESLRRRAPPSAGLPLTLGRKLTGGIRSLAGIAAPARLWSLKAIFIPLYALSLYILVGAAADSAPASIGAWFVLVTVFAYTIDLTFGLAGYLFASNDLIPTIRSTQPRLFGWIVCLLCYGPAFEHWPAFKTVVTQEIAWPQTLAADPATICAAAAMLALLALYISATVCFGLRFSNLSNRGIVTGGPYRYMKHPAYFAHVGNAWIITLAFLVPFGTWPGLPLLLVPLAFTVLYRLRAVTEEQHLSEDPDYRAYAEWIARHGIAARALGALRKLRVFRPGRASLRS